MMGQTEIAPPFVVGEVHRAPPFTHEAGWRIMADPETMAWLPADGSTFASSDHPALAKLLGTTYGGTADRPALPDLRGN